MIACEIRVRKALFHFPPDTFPRFVSVAASDDEPIDRILRDLPAAIAEHVTECNVHRDFFAALVERVS